MKSGRMLKFIISLSFLSFTGCTAMQSPYFTSGAVGGVSGAAIGAGTGAVVASLISSGDVAGSALLGGAIGLPVGIIAGVAYRSYMEEDEIDTNNAIIQANHDYIVARQIEIDALRDDLIDDSHRIRPDKSRRSDIYTGSTIGTYNR